MAICNNLWKCYKLSKKQRIAMNWWKSERGKRLDAIICDGAVRSGKTLSMSLGFMLWASGNFNDSAFALCGKTITSLRRNVVTPIVPLLKDFGFGINERVSGKDEGSASLIQGMTLSGVFFDEVALMPRSFVEQAVARCSVIGSKMWFNCNTKTPKVHSGFKVFGV